MKKICLITTISGTLRSFVVGTAEFLHRKAGYDITFICDNDDAFAASSTFSSLYLAVTALQNSSQRPLLMRVDGQILPEKS